MSSLVRITPSIASILSIVVPFGTFAMGEKPKGRYKIASAANLFLPFGTMMSAAVVMLSGDAQVVGAGSKVVSAADMGYLSAVLITGLSCLGGGIAISAATSTALGTIGENSSVLDKSLIFVDLVEGVCLYGLIISFAILGKLQTYEGVPDQ